jgi:hypothetical protein
MSFSRGYVPGVNNKKLKEIILKNPKPVIEDTKDPAHVLGRYEDTKFSMNPEFEKILNHINAQFSYLHHQKLELLDFWAQIHEKNMSTVIHNHIWKDDYEGNNSLSGVYYVQVPKKSGRFVFLYPYNSHVTNKFSIMPKTGEFFLFPSPTDHYVTRNLSNDLRISVSFNFIKVKE